MKLGGATGQGSGKEGEQIVGIAVLEKAQGRGTPIERLWATAGTATSPATLQPLAKSRGAQKEPVEVIA